MPDDWKAERAAKFPQEVVHLAQASERAHGVPAALSLAQWYCESEGGKKPIGKYNVFGIKYHPACGFPAITEPTHEYVNGRRIEVDAQFIDFPSLDAAFDYHARLIANPNGPYAKCRVVGTAGWQAYVACVCRTYATDPHYAETIMVIITENHLADFNLPKGT